MKKNLLIVRNTVLLVLLHACSSTMNPVYENDAHLTALDEASYSISHALVDLSATAQAAHPHHVIPPEDPAVYDMAIMTSVDWSGPVLPLIQQIAQVANYRVRVLGTEPNIPIVVTVNAKNEILGDILRNIGYQCARRAAIIVLPESKVIELRYAKN